MHCVVTAGPTYEPLDEVRRLTNFSTGKLGVSLAGHLTRSGHRVRLFLGEQATWRDPAEAARVDVFTTTEDLKGKLAALAGIEDEVQAVFHVAAVSDFAFGKVWRRQASGELAEVRAGKVSSRLEGLMVELVPAPKIIASLRSWFPRALLVGWKYEMDGGREDVLAKARAQMEENRTDACVVNGRAYGAGFGWLPCSGEGTHVATDLELFEVLARVTAQRSSVD
jgi:phosphopantothenoylcysteine decarboxylase/phosphopantothenate--cysteine ligase